MCAQVYMHVHTHVCMHMLCMHACALHAYMRVCACAGGGVIKEGPHPHGPQRCFPRACFLPVTGPRGRTELFLADCHPPMFAETSCTSQFLSHENEIKNAGRDPEETMLQSDYSFAVGSPLHLPKELSWLR